MKRHLTLLFLLICLPYPAKGQKGARNTNKNQQNTQEQTIRSTSPTRVATTSSQQKATNNEKFTKRYGWNYHDAVSPQTWPNWALVLVGIGGIIAALYTLRNMGQQTRATVIAAKATQRSAAATRISAEATEASVRLQRAISRQWLNIENMSIGPIALSSEEGKSKILELRFDIVNPTNMMLELKRIEIWTDEQKQSSIPNKPLAPTKSYSFAFPMRLSKAETIDYTDDALNRHIFGIVEFKDAFGEKMSRMFGYILGGGVNRLTFKEFEGWSGADEEE